TISFQTEAASFCIVLSSSYNVLSYGIRNEWVTNIWISLLSFFTYNTIIPELMFPLQDFYLNNSKNVFKPIIRHFKFDLTITPHLKKWASSFGKFGNIIFNGKTFI